MKKNLTFKELIFVASMLFGMFFGAGNLIFPIFMGQLAGHHVWAASAGFLRKLLKPGTDAIMATVKEKMELFGSIGQA